MAEAAPLPRRPAGRILSIDALRGIALCGILLINIFQMGGAIAMNRPLAAPAIGNADWQVWVMAQLFVTGTMRGLFSLLFGVGLLILVGDDESPDRTLRFVRRMLLLFLFGVVDCTLLLWPGDILITYALAGFVVLMIHPLKPSGLIAAAAVILMAITAWTAFDARTMPPESTVYTARMLATEGAARLGSYWQTFNYMAYVSWSWTVNALSYRYIGDAVLMMLIGMVLYRKGMLVPGAKPALTRRLLWIGYGVGIPLRMACIALVFGNKGEPTLFSALVDQPARVAMTLGHFALFQTLWTRVAGSVVMVVLGAMGRMALTLYLGQSLIAACIFSGFGLGLWNALSWPQLWLLAAAILAGQGLFASLWLRAFRYGPAEYVWRWATYGRRP